MIALALLAYVVAAWCGEAIRDVAYGQLTIDQVSDALLNKLLVNTNAHPKWLIYSGLFVLLKQKLRIPRNQAVAVTRAAASAFGTFVYGNVRSFV